MLSATDFVSWAEKGPGAAKGRSASPGCFHTAWQVADLDDLPKDRVRNYMTSDPVTVAPATSIGTLAHLMIDAHIHRLIVIDDHNRPIGIVSSTDILAAVARAAQGARATR